jgi:hypothetical protein
MTETTDSMTAAAESTQEHPEPIKKSPLTDVGGSSSEKVLTSPNSMSSSQKSAFPFQHRTFDSRSRFGWWNVPNEEEDLDRSMIGGNSGDSTDASFDIEDKKEAHEGS